jgi:integrase
MPKQGSLKLIPPRPGHPNWVIRGSYFRITGIYCSTGTTDEKGARAFLSQFIDDIHSGAYQKRQADKTALTFSGAALSYVRAGGSGTFLAVIDKAIGHLPIGDITQAQVDELAVTLYPKATPQTRARQVYTPIAAVLRHAGRQNVFRRPKGARGRARKTFLSEEQAFALLDAADAIQPRFGALCNFLLYTGCRLGEGLRLRWADVDLANSTAYIRKTKTGEPRMAFLPPTVVANLANLNAAAAIWQPEYNQPGASVFRLNKCGKLYDWFDEASAKAGIEIDERIAFHVFRHTYGAWLRHKLNMDTAALVATGAWKSRDAAAVYEHVDVSHEARKAAMLPVRGRK